MTSSRFRTLGAVLTASTLAGLSLTSLTTVQAQPSNPVGSSLVYDGAEAALRGSSQLGSSQNTPRLVPNFDPEGFYASLPSTVEGAPGAIIKTQPANFALGLPLIDWAGSHAQRIAYVTTTSTGKTVPTTGTVLQSTAPWRGPGPRPLLVVAPGTQGSSDACAPSKLLTWGMEYEGVPIAMALARGWNVALADLVGLGTNRQHTYMNRVDQAHATLDMARAAKNLSIPGIDDAAPVATWGYSQGGGASAAALELASTYAPDVRLAGGYAGGVPADLTVVGRAIDDGALAAAMGYALNGFVAEYPEVRAAAERRLNEKGRAYLAKTADECIPESLLRHMYADSRELTVDGASISELMTEEPFRSMIEQQYIGARPPKVPVFVGQGTNDDTIPAAQARRMAREWAAGGTPVYYQEQTLPRIMPLGDHMAPMFTLATPALDWLEKVVSGQPYPTTPIDQIPPTRTADPVTPGSVTGSADTAGRGVPGSVEGILRGPANPRGGSS